MRRRRAGGRERASARMRRRRSSSSLMERALANTTTPGSCKNERGHSVSWKREASERELGNGPLPLPPGGAEQRGEE